MDVLISVIVPIYGVEKYLDKCVQSIVDQTYQKLEIILVDDGSKDGCGRMCDEWADKDKRIRVIHKENGGLSDARNAGYAIARGEYISFIDSDDCISPDFYQTLKSAMEETGAEIAECGTRYIDENGGCIKERSTQEGCFDRTTALKMLIREKGFYQTVWNKLYQREVIGGLLFEKGRYNEDEFWTYQVFDKATKIVGVAKPMYDYLQRGSSIIGVGYNLRRLDGLEALHARAQYFDKDEELCWVARQAFQMSCLWHLQSVLRYVEGETKRATAKDIVKLLKSTQKLKSKELTLTKKYKLWYQFFYAMPIACARLRNILKIGL